MSYKNIIDSENEVFFTRFGSLYTEFKNNKGFLSTQYYFIYFFRRVAYVLSQVYLNSHLLVQNTLNLILSVLQTAFLIYYKPFKEKHILFSNYIGESCVLIVFSIGYVFIFEEAQSFNDIAADIFIFSILAGMALQFLITLYCFYLCLKGLLLCLLGKKICSDENDPNFKPDTK